MTTMHDPLGKFRIDASSALSQGRREYQEDAVIADFSRGTEFGFAVLADGMGGHASGELASKIVVTEVFSELMLQRNDRQGFASDVAGVLRQAATSANDCLKAHVKQNAKCRGMGATLVVSVIIDHCLHWISIGDSPLLLFRNGLLKQLNEDHSMAPEIDLLVEKGELNAEEGENHPERNVLKSVLFGETIPKIDCPAEPFCLYPGDILIVASDGLQFLSSPEIERLLLAHPFSRSDQLADLLLKKLEALDEPDLDNVSMTIIRVLEPYDNFARHPGSVSVKQDPVQELSFASQPIRKIYHSTRGLLKESYTTTASRAGSHEG